MARHSPVLERRTCRIGVHDEVHAEVAPIESHRERVDQERHVVDDDVDTRVAVGRRVHADEGLARGAARAEPPVLERGTGELVGRPRLEVVVAELFVIRPHERVGAGGIRRADELADVRHHVVATGHEVDHTVHCVLIGMIRCSRMLGV